MKMRFKIDGKWQELTVKPLREFVWQGLNFVLHKGFNKMAEPYRVSHRESGMLIWEGGAPAEVRDMAMGLMEQATKGGVAKSILKELGV